MIKKSLCINMKKPVERRKNGRLQVRRDAFVAFRPDYVTLGQIVNLSMGGLAFRCIRHEKPSNESSELDIFLPGSAFYLYKVPFVIIWSLKTPSDTSSYSSPTWQGGVQFGELKAHEESQLKDFIENCTTSRVHVDLGLIFVNTRFRANAGQARLRTSERYSS
ncbi:MAG TPA: PilZ domain-containing protein, partial [Desulfobacterales bacterium]|nr:PilZ domain-containing protein [Desulfobacterales bacterium]